MQEPFRDTFLNIPTWIQVLLYITAAIAIGVFVYGYWRRVRQWRQGQPATRTDHPGERIKRVLLYALGQLRVLAQRYAGIMHLGLFWGFILLFLGTVLATIDYDVTLFLFDFKLLKGKLYLLYELTLDLFGLAFVIALAMGLYRRLRTRPPQLSYFCDFSFALTLLLTINVTGFLLEGLRIAIARPAWSAWSPVGYAVSQLFVGWRLDTVRAFHLGTWLFHAALSLGLVAVIPFNENLRHILITPLNIFFDRLQPAPGILTPIENIEEAEFFGVGQLSEFTWKQRLGFDACTYCGRCQAACPAYAAGTPLSPKQIIVKLGDEMRLVMKGGNGNNSPALHGDVITANELWACTTCLACVRQCPVFIEIVEDIVDLRRYLTLSEGQLPATAATSLRQTMTQGNPWGYPAADRHNWMEGLDVPFIEVGQPVEYLYWVGCAAAYDRRARKIAQAVVKVLKAAGVRFAVMAEETCNGDAARRLGDEYLFQTLAQANVENLDQYSFQKIITHCPHCFNVLKNEYPQFGGNYQVLHHSQVISELVNSGRLKPSRADHTITFHDSCYLGRYNDIYDAPRAALAAVTTRPTIEMSRSREKGLCCGGGGGHMWMEVEGETRVNFIRMEEAIVVNPDVVGTACPFCMSMLEDARKVKGVEERIEVKDVAELVAEALVNE